MTIQLSYPVTSSDHFRAASNQELGTPIGLMG